MPIDDFDRLRDADVDTAQLPAIAPLRLVAVFPPEGTPQRRRVPRRQIVAGSAVERRHAERRQRRPGIDGLLRMVLSDNWR